jgi:hypothetical protein
MKLTGGQITTALEIHGFKWRESKSGVIYAFEVATMRTQSGDIVDASHWVKAPTTQRGMLAWLGY